ncbi:MAG: hypothetical protein LBH05_04050 [Deferribacteraceae bacterium]|jgi:hypothetical protein|nr:hypothetical protein [Deferribacteraceae bacterium]
MFLTILNLACGYQIVGLNASGGKKFNQITYYIEEIYNNTADRTITPDLKQNVTRFFSDYGSLQPKQSATYKLTVSLNEYSITAATLSSSRDAVTSNLTVAYSFNVSDAAGTSLYSKTIARTQNFSAGNSADRYERNLYETFISVTEDLLSEFKNDFESDRN